MVHREFARKLGWDLGEPFRLQLRRVRYAARGRAAAMMLRQPVRREHMRIARIGYLMQGIARPAPLLGDRVGLLSVQRVVNRTLQGTTVGRPRPVLEA